MTTVRIVGSLTIAAAAVAFGGLRPVAPQSVISDNVHNRTSNAQQPRVEPREPPSDWTQVHPDGATTCAFGTPFSFFHHAGTNPSRLLIYFEGGGACWEWVSCSGLFDTTVEPGEVSAFRGIFDFENPDNPFHDFAVVFIPYCTGDVHVGDTLQHYGDDPNTRPVRHRGFQNVSAVFKWMDTQRFEPNQVVVSGASAGSYGALFYMPLIARRFPHASLIMIGDSGVPLLQNYPTILERWGAASVLRRTWATTAMPTESDLTLPHAHQVAYSSRPEAILTEITSDRDAIQSAFYLISGSPRWREDTYQMLDSLEQAIPSFHSFVVAGADHGLMRTNRFYDYEADGVSLRDWVQRLLNGNPVSSHRCRACQIRIQQ